MTHTLRVASAADIEAIAALHYAGSWRSTYANGPILAERLAAWQERLSEPASGQYVVVAEDDGAIVGFACALADDDSELGTLLDNLHVRLALHRRGIGKRLVIEIARWCTANYPDSGLYLGVLQQNENAQRFYQRLGARDVRGGVAASPSGDSVPSRIYAWTREQVADLATR